MKIRKKQINSNKKQQQQQQQNKQTEQVTSVIKIDICALCPDA